jgi:putative redox protein
MSIQSETSGWVSAVVGLDHYKTTVITDTHTIVADEPIDNGGKDLGPHPGDFLRMSLATCTAITLRMYADRKGYDVTQIEVKVNTRDVENTTVFNTQIQITGNVDEKVRTRMMQIAKLCPVHKMLARPIEIETHML